MKKYDVEYAYYIEGINKPYGVDNVTVEIKESGFDSMFNNIIFNIDELVKDYGYDMVQIRKIKEA